MKRSIFALFAALAVASATGCSSPLATAVRVSNALGAVASTGGAASNTAFARAEHACLWRPDGSETTSSLMEQRSCIASVRAEYAGPLKAYDDFYAAWTALSAAVHAAEAAEVLGRAPDLTKLESLITALVTASDAADRAVAEVSQ